MGSWRALLMLTARKKRPPITPISSHNPLLHLRIVSQSSPFPETPVPLVIPHHPSSHQNYHPSQNSQHPSQCSHPSFSLITATQSPIPTLLILISTYSRWKAGSWLASISAVSLSRSECSWRLDWDLPLEAASQAAFPSSSSAVAPRPRRSCRSWFDAH